MPTMRSVVSLGVALSTLCFAAACGDSSTAPSGDKLSAAEAQAVASALFEEMANTLNNSGVATTTGTISGQSACSLGGSMSVSGTYVDNLDSKGTGSVAGSGSFTPANCVVSSGTKNITVNGDPKITWTIALNFAQFEQSGDATFGAGGGFKWAGGSCALNYSVTFDAAGDHATAKGTVCGQSIDGSF